MPLINFSTQGIAPAQSFDALPAGKYSVMAMNTDMKATKNGLGRYLEIEWQVLDGAHANRKVWSRLNVENPNAKAVEIAQRELAAICHAVGKPAGVQMTEELHGVPMVIDVAIEEGSSGQTNRVRSYMPLNNAQPQPQQQQFTPPPAQQATPARNAAPWAANAK